MGITNGQHMNILIVGVNSNSVIMEHVESSTAHLDGVHFTSNHSYAQILTQIANFYHNFMTLVTIGLKSCQKTCKTQP